MAATNSPSHNTQHDIPKENSVTLPTFTPPPAYSPHRTLDLSALDSRVHSTQLVVDAADVLSRSSFIEMTSGQTSEHDEAEPEGTSAISLRINTSINISNDNSLVCITEMPDQHAKAIAHAVVKAMRENSSGNCGIPMIDEDGRPRPINIEVDASIAIDGANNIIGHEGIIREALRQRGSLRRRREEHDDEEHDNSGSEASAKRRRSTS